LGVPLFQEQAMQIAIERRRLQAGEGRQAAPRHGDFRGPARFHRLKNDFINGMKQNGTSSTLRALLQADEGFGEYGFPKAMPASFAILVYDSSWVKWYYPRSSPPPAQFQPMGFYARPSSCATRASTASRCGRPTSMPATGIAPWSQSEQSLRATALAFVRSRASPRTTPAHGRAPHEPYRDPGDLWRRSGSTSARSSPWLGAMPSLSLGLSRRDVLWAVRGFSDAHLPLLDDPKKCEISNPRSPALTHLGEQVVDDYGSISMSLRSTLGVLRPRLSDRGVSLQGVKNSKNDDLFTLGGLSWCATPAPPRA